MKNFGKALALLMPNPVFYIIYILSLTLLFILMINGFKVTGEYSAEFYGMKLLGFSIEGKNIAANAYVEFCFHLWWAALLTLTFVMLKPYMNSWNRDFRNFLRFSRQSRFFMEAARAAALVCSVFLLLVPFVFACLMGKYFLNLEWSYCGWMLSAVTSSVMFVAGMTSVFAWFEETRPLCACMMMAPFFSGGIALFIGKQWEKTGIQYWIPCLPYSVAKAHCFQSLWTACIFLAAVILLRIFCTCRTRRI